MTTLYDNSGSEDGQLRSPGDEQFISGDELDEHDADSLDIKPPQATTHYSRDAIVKDSKRREKFIKEKKHSKERRQHKDRSSGDVSNTGASSGGHERERERDRRAAAIFRDGRPEIERYQRSGGSSGGAGSGYERNDSGRYQKHYDRPRDNHATMLLHHNQHQSAPMHLHRRQADYYERVTEYHHHGNDYHGMRQSYTNKHHGQRIDYGHDMSASVVASNMQNDRERERERRKYGNYESQQDAESLEQDLRSRLLSKRHKYVKDYDPAMRKHQMELEHSDGYEDRERTYEEPHKDRHTKSRHEKEIRNNVIEVFDSPDIDDFNHETVTTHQSHNRKHKRREKEKIQESSLSNAVEKHRSPEDAELVARRAKLLVAEREITKRKEVAREELEARREKRRERGVEEIGDELSPTAVAANVTAGLNIVVKRHNNLEKRKKSKKSKHQRSDYEEGEHQGEYQGGESGTDDRSEAESEHSVTVNKRRKHSLEAQQHGKKKKRKNNKQKNGENIEDSDGQLTDDEDVSMKVITRHSDSESPAESDENYKKNKSKRKHTKKSSEHEKKHRRKKHTPVEEDEGAYENEDDDDDDQEYDDEDDEVLKLPDSPLSIGELSKSPERRHRKSNNSDEHDDDEDEDRFRSSRSRTLSRSGSHSRTHSPQSSTHSSSRSVSRSRSSSRRRRSISTSRSRSHTQSSGSRSRSRSRSEERDMQANLRKSDAEQNLSDAEKHKLGSNIRSDGKRSSSSPIPCDDKGVALPNYYPGLQGCRSVEEFQCLNRIEEGTYGVVYRAKDKRTNEIVALKRLKMEKEKEGFPITSLREINTLLKGQHPNIVTVREIVVGSNMDKIFIVMDYVEHDLKSLMETMKTRKQCFLPGEVKCLTQQLLSAVGHLHDNWILHRDLKTSNLLLSHKGILKVGDFGLAREYGSPLKKYTSLVVTLWYRAPELLLCSPEYSTPIDIWSVGCIFAEFLQMAPLFPGKSEIDELNRIFKELGTPNDKIWPGYKDLPAVKNLLSQNSQFADYPVSNLRKRFHDKTTDLGIAFLHGLLTYDPKQRLNAEAALKHAYFKELPLPIDPSMFPTWPAKSELGARKAMASSPKPPSGGSQFKQLGRDEMVSNSVVANKTNASHGFSGIITGNKKTAANTGFVLNAGIEQRQLAMGPGFNLKF